MKKLWYFFIKYIIKTSLFFYFKRIRVVGIKNIPKKGAVLFMVNHPNGLLDPLVVSTNNSRILHYLVRAAVFKKPLIKKILGTLNLMPIYRIRDGVKELSKNKDVFDTCIDILKNKKALMIFPEGSHNRTRTIRPLSKGFTRIVFGTLEKYPDLKIQIVPVGLTYQNSSQYPSKTALYYGKPIFANDFYNKQNLNKSIIKLKEEVNKQLKTLSVHIPFDEDYKATINMLNKAKTDFTEVEKINKKIKEKKFKRKKPRLNFILILKPLLILNTLIPWLIWKLLKKQIKEIEFIDTFRLGTFIVLAPIFYTIQTCIIQLYFTSFIAVIYAMSSLCLLILYCKLHSTPPELLVE